MKYQFFAKTINLKFVVILGVAALATCATSFYLVLNNQLENQKRSQQAIAANNKIQASPNAVAARGYLEPKGEVIKLSAPTSIQGEGVRLAKLLVKQGDKVKTGQVVAILDNQERLQAALEQAKTEVNVSQAKLEQTKAGAKTGDINAQTAKYQQTRAELEGQLTIQRATIANLAAQLQGEKNSQAATIKRIQAELQYAQTECDRYNALYQKGVVSASQRDSTCLQNNTAQEQLAEAESNLQKIITTRTEQVKEAQANFNRTLATLKKEVEEAKATLNATAEVRPVDVNVAESELKNAQAAVKKSQANLNLAYVRSPKNGQVLKIHTWAGEVISNDGIIELGQTEQMYAIAEVYETDISKVRLGQQATVTSGGLIEELKGNVDEVGLKVGVLNALGTDPVADADTRVVEVKIRLSPQYSRKVANLTNLEVNVMINTESPSN
ncbi:ABC exporter membrane fusion protein [Nostoc punctiforme]|uniref:Heterocyst specific ABC-transporter, membrane fusion protein DevB-like protein n=1 Tax=Nostoc punctiforme (strain ATCC 29133 / PCC 73102) TaxID=63737 RepID=B2IYQ0_NOSP7|nr:ABC exporter membrane fusion protein [Nostoc punctiforme]ACC81633.1 heterocyst specific ABC-transporter, membrane fusion protein DevB-like protein [Nostoc punctiforme PCC 73102]